MSDPRPGHVYGENEYKDELPTKKEKREYIKGLKSAVSHKKHLDAKKGEMAKKIFNAHHGPMSVITDSILGKRKNKHDVGQGKGGRDEYDDRLDERNPFIK